MNLNKFKKGIVKVEINAIAPERLINMLWNKGIQVENVQKLSITTILFEVQLSDYKIVREIAKKINAKISIVGKRGPIFKFIGLKNQFSLLIGGVLFLGILYYLSGFLWKIDIETNKYLSPFEIRQQLKELGIVQGIRKSSMNVYELEKKLENDNSEIMWIRARLEGSTLRIKVEEKVSPPEIIKEEINNSNDVTAKMEGEIVRIYTTAGTALVEPGDTVKKGQVIIKGIEGKEGEEFEIKAEGSAIANTFYERTMEIQVEGEKVEKTGNKEEEVYIEILGKKIYLKKSAKKFIDYDKIEKKGKILNKISYYEKKSKKIYRSKEEIINDAVNEFYNSTMKNIGNQGKFVDKVLNVEDIDDEKVKLNVIFIIEQDISVQSSFKE